MKTMQGKGGKSKQNKFCNFNFFCPGITFSFKNIAKFFAKNEETCFVGKFLLRKIYIVVSQILDPDHKVIFDMIG